MKEIFETFVSMSVMSSLHLNRAKIGGDDEAHTQIFSHTSWPGFNRTNTLIYVENSFRTNKISLGHKHNHSNSTCNAAPNKPLQQHRP